MQREIHERMRRTVTKIAESAGASAELSIDKKTLITYNNPALVKRCCLRLQRTAGEANTVWMDAMTGSEDFLISAKKFLPSFSFWAA